MAINYDRITWQNDGVTPLNANNLNRMESGIKDACDGVDWIKNHINKTLWTGSWSSGTITVPDTDQYNVFIIYMVDMGTAIPVLKHGIYLRGWGGAAGDVAASFQFAATHQGDIWTLVSCTGMNHNSTSNHGTATSKTVSAIVGLI